MFYVYILLSEKDNRLYVGSTNDLRKRLDLHNSGQVPSTRYRRPLKIIYYEACPAERDARIREKYLKTAWGKRYIKNRLKYYFESGVKIIHPSGIVLSDIPRGRPVRSEGISPGQNGSNAVRLRGGSKVQGPYKRPHN